MIKLIDILLEDIDKDIKLLDSLLYKWINYAGSHNTLPEIEQLSKKLKINTLPDSEIVYRVVPMVGEDIKDYPPQEIIKIDRQNKIVFKPFPGSGAFDRYEMPLYNIDRHEMINISKENDWIEILYMTWSCWYPDQNKPCGKCDMCKNRKGLFD